MITLRSGGTSVSAAIVRQLCRLFVKPALTHFPLWRPLLWLLPLIDLVARVLPRPRAIELQRIGGGTWHAELVCPLGQVDPRGAIVYFHGGAFLFGGVASHRRIVARLAELTGLPVLSVGYRQLPFGLLDDAIADSVAAHDWLVDVGIDPATVVLVGDSAGGHLAFATALELKRMGRVRPAGIVGLSPWLDFDDSTKLMHPNVERDVAIPAVRLAPVARLCVGSEEVHPERSPVNADLTGLPPVLMHCSADEVLRHDAELMAERLEAAGVPCSLDIWAGMVHAFPILGKALKESRTALDELGAFVHRAIVAGPQDQRAPVGSLAARLEQARPGAVPMPVAAAVPADPFPPLPPERPVVTDRRALPGRRAGGDSRVEGVVA